MEKRVRIKLFYPGGHAGELQEAMKGFLATLDIHVEDDDIELLRGEHIRSKIEFIVVSGDIDDKTKNRIKEVFFDMSPAFVEKFSEK